MENQILYNDFLVILYFLLKDNYADRKLLKKDM